ncbi:RNA polymerase sigma factor [bacterium]|nr:RNA polymerase sigma factor [bacterium]
MTVNHCINEYRKDKTRKKYIETTDDETLSRHSDLEIDLDDSGEYSAEVLEIVKKEILNLPATTQEVFQLFILDGLSHKEIADSLGMQEGTSKWHVNNARKKLKEVLKGTLKIISSLVL